MNERPVCSNDTSTEDSKSKACGCVCLKDTSDIWKRDEERARDMNMVL